MTALSLCAVTKRFGDTVALDGVDLAIDDGEIVVLVGPSGCGKSTLLRIVAGLIGADSGTVAVGSDVVDDGTSVVDPEHRNVGLVFQEHALFPHLTIGRNLMFGLNSLARDARFAERDEWLQRIGLAGQADRYPHELSGGERQRVALARALAPRPKLMLLDEPFASLDPTRRTQLRGDVVDLLRSSETAAVFVTHDQLEAFATGDRVAVMNDGRVEQIDTPDAVYERPANPFVAGFMAEANLLAVHGDGTTELGTVVTGEPPTAGALVVVRPSDVVLVAGGDGEVVAAEYRGGTTSHVVRLPSGQLVRSNGHRDRLPIGTQVAVRVRPGPHAVVAPTRDERTNGAGDTSKTSAAG